MVMSFYQDQLRDEYEERLKSEDVYESEIKFIMKNHGVTWEEAEKIYQDEKS